MELTHGPITGRIPEPYRPGRTAGRERIALDEAAGLVEVLAVADEVEGQPEMLDFLEGCGLVPGLWAEVVSHTSACTRVVGARAHAVLPPSLAAHVLVRPIDPLTD